MNAKKKFEKMLSMILALAMVFTAIGVVPAKAATYQMSYGLLKEGDENYKEVGKMPFETGMSVSINSPYSCAFNEDRYYPLKANPSGLPTGYDTYVEYSFSWIGSYEGQEFGVTGIVGPIAAPDGYALTDAKITVPANSYLSSVTLEKSTEQGNTYKIVADNSAGESACFYVAYKKAGSSASTGTNTQTNTNTTATDKTETGKSSTATGTTTTGTKDTLPAVKTTLESQDGKANYTVTKSAAGAVEVAYTAPVKKNASSVVILPTVTLKDGTEAKVTSISANAFKGNKKIKNVTIGKNITNIGANAFNGCKNLKKITFKTTKVKFGKKVFKNVKKGCIVYYPKSLKGSKLKKFKTTLKTAGLKSAKYKKK